MPNKKRVLRVAHVLSHAPLDISDTKVTVDPIHATTDGQTDGGYKTHGRTQSDIQTDRNRQTHTYAVVQDITWSLKRPLHSVLPTQRRSDIVEAVRPEWITWEFFKDYTHLLADSQELRRSMADGSTTVGLLNECKCRFDGCERPKPLFDRALDGRTVVYPPNSEEARLDDLVVGILEGVDDALEYTLSCSDEFRTMKCLECGEVFGCIDKFDAHCKGEINRLSRRLMELLSERQKLPGKSSYAIKDMNCRERDLGD
jgi:hypothetical protein